MNGCYYDKLNKKELEEKNNCLHCGSKEAAYCEKCYQELIGTNAKLQLKQCTHNIDNECIRKSKIDELLKELNNEYRKSEEIFNKHFEKETRDMNDYYIQKEATSIMQEISWVIGKIEEMLESEE